MNELQIHITVDHYWHGERRRSRNTDREREFFMGQLDQLAAEVRNMESVVQAQIALNLGIAARIAEIDDHEQAAALATELRTAADSLAQSVVANTPAAVSEPTPGEVVTTTPPAGATAPDYVPPSETGVPIGERDPNAPPA